MTTEQIVNLITQAPLSVLLALAVYKLYVDTRAVDRLTEQSNAAQITALAAAVAANTVSIDRLVDLANKMIINHGITKQP